MSFYQSIDPFLMQLFIIPFIVIGLGVLASLLTKNIFAAPLVTLVLNLVYETTYYMIFYDRVLYSSWNIIFPSIAFALAIVVLGILKIKEKFRYKG